MKSIKYILGLGVVVAIIDITLLWVLNLASLIDGVQFSDYLSRSLSIVGVVVLALLVISLVLKMFKSE